MRTSELSTTAAAQRAGGMVPALPVLRKRGG